MEAEFADNNDCALTLERANVYALLSSAFAGPPNQALINVISQCEIPDNGAWTSFQSAFKQTNLEQLDEEYHRLFIGVGCGELVPYCSYYLTGFLMEKPLLALREYMQTMGLDKAPNQSDPEDHIAGNFEIMKALIADLEQPYAQQKHFFNHYILPWVEKFLNDLTALKNINYYHHLGHFAQWFIGVEKKYFNYY